MSKVFLMGMPGSGKTTVGKKLAVKLGLPFIDLDQYIEEKEKKSVQEIFAEQGEATFRKIESECLIQLITHHSSLLLSLGGGTPCYNNNLELIKKNGLSVYLEVPPLMLVDRLKAKGKEIRPLFNGLNDEQFESKISEMLHTREQFYRQASLVLDGKSLKPASAAEVIAALLDSGTTSD